MHGKKILLMGHADGLGGSQTAFWQLYYFLQKEGYTLRVVALTDNGHKLPFRKGELIGQIAHHKSTIPLAVQKGFDVLKAGIKARLFQPDIFVSVGLNNSVNHLSRLLAKKCFTIGQDFIADRKPDDPLWHKSRATMRGIAVQAPAMLTHWQQPEKKFEGLNWLPCFPEPPVHDVWHTKQAFTAEKKIKLAYFGRLADNKGLPLVLQAFAQPAMAGATFDIWGKGAEEAHLRQIVGELGLEKVVNFLGGYPAAKEGAELMASYDALILCSTHCEGLPLILLEAMAYGLPFLTTDVGAIRDCCVGNADVLMVEPTQAAINSGLVSLTAKIRSNNFDSQRLRNFYDKTFSYDVMAARWNACLQNPVSFFYGA